ncbi:ABC transporter permease [Pseudonocardia cypriaca]|uniref:ABC-2 type transport system permease protein n=1 Tax=Pseudonocardia cypriaca TaxID=882449 RepID=A0A543FMT1_9PSEU|nr:ABC-2 family transporter protein [Pseudonocardia cypriaca]TQM35131.1 ABC-2 type transport system permease protein [Pseudonocardia cypriaca]
MDRVRIHLRILGSRVRSQLAYPVSFTLDTLGQALGHAAELVVILAVFAHVDALGGFARDEVLLIFGLAAISFGLADLAVGQLDDLPRWIRTGELDVLLARPLGVLPQLVTSDLQLRRLGRSAVGVVVLAIVLAQGQVEPTPLNALLVIGTPLIGTTIISSIWVVTCSVSFWVIEGRELANAFTYGSQLTTAYPITVFGPWLRRLLCYAVPGAFVAYFPALALLDRPDPLGLPHFLRYAAPLVAVAAVLVAALVWRTAVRHYQGAGS